MICLIALIVFSILGIFSVKHRKLAFKAFDCVFRRVTLRPCQSGLDRKLRTYLLGLVSRKNVKSARILAKHFELISWIFTALLIVSLLFSVRGVYFYLLYGNCNGENSEGFCVFDALNTEHDVGVCYDPSISTSGNMSTPNRDDDPAIGPKNAKVIIIEFGCYSCPYTKKAQPVVAEILKKYGDKVRFIYRDFPLPTHVNSEARAIAAECADEQDKFWDYHTLLFDNFENLEEDMLIELAAELNLNLLDFMDCLTSTEIKEEVQADFNDGKEAGIFGTPTFFINDVIVVGPKPFRYFQNIIDNELSE